MLKVIGGYLVKMHPRYQPVREQKNKVERVFLNALRETDLTYIEAISLLTDIMAQLTKGALREERHPNDPSKPADAE